MKMLRWRRQVAERMSQYAFILEAIDFKLTSNESFVNCASVMTTAATALQNQAKKLFVFQLLFYYFSERRARCN
jgi:hypothetical protein